MLKQTKFFSLDDQAQALLLLLNTNAGRLALKNLVAGVRQTLDGTINRTLLLV